MVGWPVSLAMWKSHSRCHTKKYEMITKIGSIKNKSRPKEAYCGMICPSQGKS